MTSLLQSAHFTALLASELAITHPKLVVMRDRISQLLLAAVVPRHFTPRSASHSTDSGAVPADPPVLHRAVQLLGAIQRAVLPLVLLCLVAPSDPVWAATHPPLVRPRARTINFGVWLSPKLRPPKFASFSYLFAPEHLSHSRTGVRQRLKQHGITFDITENIEGFSNFLGGKDKGQAAALTTMARATLHMRSLVGLRGGKAHISLWDHIGRNPTQALVGDSQVFDKLNFRPYFNIYQLWYQQELWHRKLRIKVGKIDANSEFSVNQFGLIFLNSSAQLSAAEFALPSTPAPMPGIDLFVRPFGDLYSGFGFYHSNKHVGFLNFQGDPESVRAASSGNLYVGEAGLDWNHLGAAGADGYAKFGYWGHTGAFTRVNGGTQRGAEGFYFLLGQKLGGAKALSDGNRGIRTFFEYSRSNPAVSKVYRHFGEGITWTGFMAHRRHDVVGFGPQCVSLSPQLHLPHSYELALESFYRMQITNWWSVEPDLQNILHPGGTNPSGLVGSVQVKIKF